MKEDVVSPGSALPDDAAHRSLSEDIRTLTTAGRDLAQAELAYQKARAAYAGKAMRVVTSATAAALALAFVALMALVMGLILTLVPILTPIGATAAVVAGLLIAATLCVMVARNRLQSMKSVLGETPGSNDA